MALLPLSLLGCASAPQPPLRLYSGPPLENKDVARIVFDEAIKTQPLFGYWEWLELRKFDDNAVNTETNARRSYDVLPGNHRLGVRYMYDSSGTQGLLESLLSQSLVESMTQRFESVIFLDAKAGAEYKVRFKVEKESPLTPVWNWKVQYWIEDSATGAVASGEKH